MRAEARFTHAQDRSRDPLRGLRTPSGWGDLERSSFDQISNAPGRSIDRAVHMPPVHPYDRRPGRLEHHGDDASGAVGDALPFDVQDRPYVRMARAYRASVANSRYSVYTRA